MAHIFKMRECRSGDGACGCYREIVPACAISARRPRLSASHCSATMSGPLRTAPPASAALLRDHVLGRRLQVEGGGQERAGIVALGTGENLGRGSLLHHLAVAHDEEAA